MEGFVTIVTKEKRKRIPLKRQPVYSFLQRSLNRENSNKEIVKQDSINFIQDFLMDKSEKTARFLTMPGVTWDWEKEIRVRFGKRRSFRIRAVFHGCENDYKVFCLSAANMFGCNNGGRFNPYFAPNLNAYAVTNVKQQIYLMNIDIFDFISGATHKFDRKFNVIWLDTTNTVLSVFPRLKGLENIIADNCIFMLTVIKGREHWKFENGRINYVTSFLEPYGFKLQREMPYFDTCPMLHLIYTREK